MTLFRKSLSYLCLIILINLMAISVFAQTNNKTDSLILSLRKEKNDTIRINTLTQIANHLRLSDADSALYYLNTALVELNKIKWSVKTLPENWKLKKKAMCYQYIAIIFRMKGKYPGALENNFTALRIYEQMNDQNGIALIYGNIGNVFLEQQKSDHALSYYRKALEIDSAFNNRPGIARHYGNIGAAYYNLKNINLALTYYFKYLKEGRALGRKEYEMVALGNIGVAYEELRNFDSALIYYEKARLMSHELGFGSATATYIGNMGWIFCQMGKFPEAEKYLSEALTMARNLNALSLVSQFEQKISDLYVRTGKFEKAYQHYREYISARDSLFNAENTEKTIRAEVDFEFEKKEQKAKLEQEKKDVVAEEEKRRNKTILIAIVSGFVIVLLFSIILFNRFRIIRQQNKIIEGQKIVVEKKNKDITDSINYAQRIQKALLASESLLNENLGKIAHEHFVLFKPKDIVSGDFYWAINKNDCFYLAICDSTGHGVPGAFMSLLNISYLHEAISEKNIAEPAGVFDHARNRLKGNISVDGGKDGMDGILLKIPMHNLHEEIKIQYAAAFNYPFIVSNGKILGTSADKMPVGYDDSTEPFRNFSLSIPKGTMIYLYTDGYPDQFGGTSFGKNKTENGLGKKFKQKRLKDLLVSLSELPLSEQKSILEVKLNEWKGNLEQTDDITVLGIRF